MYDNNSLKFFLYARKSTDVEDKQILCIEAQFAEVREYVKREEISILEELIEKQSAKVPGRPIFNTMIERIEKGEPGVGIEPTLIPLPRERFTTKLSRHILQVFLFYKIYP